MTDYRKILTESFRCEEVQKMLDDYADDDGLFRFNRDTLEQLCIQICAGLMEMENESDSCDE
jgi:hypothetical protein